MSLAEIPHRFKEACLKRICRAAAIADRDARLPIGLSCEDLPVLPLRLRDLKSVISSDDATRLREDTDRLCAQQVDLLGQQWRGNAVCDWSLDPESGEHWQWRNYTFDIPRRSGQGPGDVKFVWELSRLQHLQVLALGALVFDRDDAREQCLKHLQAWIRDNPPYQGLAYASGIEMASRVISILFIVTCLGSDSIPQLLRREIWTALAVHGRWIARFPSLFSSANNHLVAECAALFILGAVARELPESERWRATAWKRLVRESGRLILVDGSGAEQSPTYLAYTMEWLLLSRSVFCADQGSDTSEIDDALCRGALFLSRISDSAGNAPSIGDCDDSAVIKPNMQDENYTGSIVTAVASVLQRGDILHRSFGPDLRSHLLSHHAVPDATLGLQSAVFEEGGYTVLRGRDGRRELFLMFDHGPLGFAQTAAHGHADALSVWLHVDGKPFLVDFGTYRYNADAGWRDWARGTAAHNTIEINARSQSETTGPFNWGRPAKSELLEYRTKGSRQFCRASHDGYVMSSGVTHERQVAIEGTDLVMISDKLSGKGSHFAKLSFQFSPSLRIKSTTNSSFSVYSGDDLISDLQIDCPGLVCDVKRQDHKFKPGTGAVSPEYNRLQPATALAITGQIELPYSCKVAFRLMTPNQPHA